MSCTFSTAALSGSHDASALRAAHELLDDIHAPRVTGLIERHYCQRSPGYGARHSIRAQALGSLRCAAVTRQSEDEGRSMRSTSFRPQPSAVNFQDGTADRQSHTHPVGFRRIEGLEGLL